MGNDLHFIIQIDKVMLSVWLNVNYARKYEPISDIINHAYRPASKDIYGRVMGKKGRIFYYAEDHPDKTIHYDEIHSYDFDKWYKLKKAHKLLPEEFSLLLGFVEPKPK